MNQTEIIEKLNQFDTEALSEGSDSAFLSRCLYSEDYAVKAKAYLVLERWGNTAAVLSLCENFTREQRQWQLRILNIIAVWRIAEAIPLLEQCLFQRACPLLIRGAFAALAEIGGDRSVALVVKFLKNPFCGYLKNEFIADSLADMLSKDVAAEKEMLRYCAEDVSLQRIMTVLKRKGSGNELLMVYPYPDYLSRCAEAAGLTPKEWKQLTYFPRRKKKRSFGNEI